MEKKVYICDYCKKELPENYDVDEERLGLVIDIGEIGRGSEMVIDHKDFHLKCLVERIQSFLNGKDRKLAAEFMNFDDSFDESE